MMHTSLDMFIHKARKQWSGLNTETVVLIRQLLIDLTQSSYQEPWLKEILDERPATKELYTDPKHGFRLLAHAEDMGTYRIPHDHGAGWVFYAVQSGETEMTTYKKNTTAHGKTHLISRGTETMRKGSCKVFLPGDIHDTRCISEGFIQYRLTSSDFKKEISEGRMIRYSQ